MTSGSDDRIGKSQRIIAQGWTRCKPPLDDEFAHHGTVAGMKNVLPLVGGFSVGVVPLTVGLWAATTREGRDLHDDGRQSAAIQSEADDPPGHSCPFGQHTVAGAWPSKGNLSAASTGSALRQPALPTHMSDIGPPPTVLNHSARLLDRIRAARQQRPDHQLWSHIAHFAKCPISALPGSSSRRAEPRSVALTSLRMRGPSPGLNVRDDVP